LFGVAAAAKNSLFEQKRQINQIFGTV